MSTTIYHPKGSMCLSCMYRDIDCSNLDFKSMKACRQYVNKNDPTVFKVVICDEFKKGGGVNSPETAPKDKQIMLDVGLPWLVMGVWNEPSGNWVYADLQMDLYDGEWNDTYFQNEHEKKIKGWLPIPDKQEVRFKQFADELITIAMQGCDADGASIQDLAVELGLFKEVTVTEKCREVCACAEVSEFPTQCYRKSY